MWARFLLYRINILASKSLAQAISLDGFRTRLSHAIRYHLRVRSLAQWKAIRHIADSAAYVIVARSEAKQCSNFGSPLFPGTARGSNFEAHFEAKFKKRAQVCTQSAPGLLACSSYARAKGEHDVFRAKIFEIQKSLQCPEAHIMTLGMF